MNVSNLLSHDAPPSLPTPSTLEGTQHYQQRAHQYPTRQAVSTNNHSFLEQSNDFDSAEQCYNGRIRSVAPGFEPISPMAQPKNVAFELLFDGPNTRARLPMRVQIFPHDTTDSILTTVKNFYGLYDGAAGGVSFEDEHNHTLIARYENLQNNMTVYVRVVPDYSQPSFPHARAAWSSTSPLSPNKAPRLEAAFQPVPPQLSPYASCDQPLSRPGSRVARKRSASPRANRGGSVSKNRSRPGIVSQDTNLLGNTEEVSNDAMNGYSDSDGGAGSVTSSRKARSEQLASAEISVDNIVEGGRRKRAKFESSELPLFVPPQVPATNSISSISPQRRSNGYENASPFAKPPQRAYTHPNSLQSPQTYGYGEYPHGIITGINVSQKAPISTTQGRCLRERSSAPRNSYSGSAGSIHRPQAFGILPTPDPTVASCISDEDVALQLMRLGDASNISHGRTSASTLDDALSGRADIASTASSDSHEESQESDQRVSLKRSAHSPYIHHDHSSHGQPNINSRERSEDEGEEDWHSNDNKDGIFKADPEDILDEFGQAKRPKQIKSKNSNFGLQKSRSNSASKKSSKLSKHALDTSQKKVKLPNASSGSKVPLSPISIATQPRKTSASTLNFQHHLGADEEDLSSKPRCQRCRKSKKGCDRQRPCQRCKDAGIGAEGCISEDEGNGRKGRFGRHMGVSVKKDIATTAELEDAGATLNGMMTGLDKSKKRKR